MLAAVTYLLLEIASFFLIYQHQIEIEAHGELLIDIPHGGCQLVAGEKQADGDGFPCV